MSWTPERNKALRQLWADGLSVTEIARQLGGVSRNAVMGKAWRLNLPARARNGQTACPSEPDPGPGPGPIQSEEPLPDRLPSKPAAHCQWIFGDAPSAYVFCTEPKRRGSSWCEAHHKRVYVARPLDGALPRRRA